MTVNKKNVFLSKGDCIVIFPMFEHNFIVDGSQKCQITQFEFSCDGTANFDNIFSGEDIDFIKIDNCTDVYESINSLHCYDNSLKTSEMYKLLFELEIQKLIVLISIHNKEKKDFENNFTVQPFRNVVDYIENNYADNINFELLSRQNGISSRYLRTLFLNYINFSPLDYLTLIRLEKAKDLLKNSAKTITYIAVNVGYNSCQYFSLIFKSKIGMSPKEFRKQYQL